MSQRTNLRVTLARVALGVVLTYPAASLAGPNLMAIGDYESMPSKRALGRDSISGQEVLFGFDDPEYDFGHVVVRSRGPTSVVRRDVFVGFTGEALVVDARGRGRGGSVRIEGLEFWLRIQGRIRPGRDYEWEIQANSGGAAIDRGFPAVIPVLWAGGDPVGVEVTVRTPQTQDDDRLRRLLLPHGVVRIPRFDRQTGGAWVVLRPENFGNYFAIQRMAFREVDTREMLETKTDMPIPVRYIPIRDVLEDDIAEALTRGAEALESAREQQRYWEAKDLEESVSLTARVVSALGELDPGSETLMPAMEWLAVQEPESEEPWSVETVAQRLYCLSRHGGLKPFRRVIHADLQYLARAQFEDGGWAAKTRGDQPQDTAIARSDNLSSATVLRGLREARFAGAVIDRHVWRRVMQYWTDAQVYDGGFRQSLERYGGVGQATTSANTSLGAAALITAVDMAAGFEGRRCNTYLASRRQLRAIDAALAWLNEHYGEPLSALASFVAPADPYGEPTALQWLGEVCGLADFNEKDHFAESARALLAHYDRDTATFGVRAPDGSWSESPSVSRTAQALTTLGAGAAPTVVQRIILGADENGWAQYKGDAAHLVRYLADRRGRPLNWRRTTIDRDVRELVEVPLLLLSVVGPFDWSDGQWKKIREYCFAGGSVVIDIAEGAYDEREAVVSALKQTFPEYELAELPSSSPIFSIETRISSRPRVKALGNGFRQFLFLPAESWSCRWHLYSVDDHESSFALINNLLTYATDGTPLRSSFAPSTYAVGSIPAHSMKVAHLEVGSRIPAFPDLVDTLDRLMQESFRLEVTRTEEAGEADLVWISVAGEDLSREQAIAGLLDALRRGRYLLVEIVSGREGWDESFRSILAGLEGVTLQRLRRTDPIFTGEVPGTQGFDVVDVAFRKALHGRSTTAGRCDLYGIRWHGRPAGTYCAYDIASGIGYHYYPGCRGVMPRDARRIAMNACLIAYAWKVSGTATP